MKITRDGPLPQVELGPALGGAKNLFQRSGIVARMITMISAMSAAWATSHTLRQLFLGSYLLFLGAAFLALAAWMVIDYTVIIPSEQTFRQGQAHRSERSPLKRDHDEQRERLERIEQQLRTDDPPGEAPGQETTETND